MTYKLLHDIIKEAGLFGIDKQMPRLGDIEGLRPPDWIMEGPLYEIFVRNFTSAGTLKAVQEKLDYIKDLGIKTIWLMPVHPIGKLGCKGTVGSPYAIRDYYEIDASLGTKAEFKKLVNAVHRTGMKIILDLVANHAANDHVWTTDNPDWFISAGDGHRIRKASDWTDVTDLNYENKELTRRMKHMIRYWVEEFDIDGYRCDVAGLVPLSFWEEIGEELQQIKADVFMLAEWQSSGLHKKAFHATYDWVLYWILKDIRKQKRGVNDLVTWINFKNILFPRHALSLLFTENHDYPRTMDTFGSRSFFPFVALLFFLKGIPLIYAGQENGARQMPPLFDTDPLDWKMADGKVSAFYATMIKLRYQHPGFLKGDMDLSAQNNEKVLVIESSSAEKTIHIYFNFSAEAQTLSLSGNHPMVGVDLLTNQVFDAEQLKLDPYQIRILDLVEDDLLMI